MDIKFWSILFFLILISILLVALLIGLIYFVLKIRQKDHSQKLSQSKINSLPQKPFPESEVLESSESLAYCFLHKETYAAAMCAICKKPLCDNCSHEDNKSIFCSDHLKLYLKSEWIELTSVTTTPDNPEDGIFLYDFQEKNWNSKKIPTFIKTHYKIDIERDYIESHVKLIVLKKNQKTLTETLPKANKAQSNKKVPDSKGP